MGKRRAVEVNVFPLHDAKKGNTAFVENEHGALTTVLDCSEPQPTSCNKETGGKRRLQKWSRSHLFVLRGGGIIDKWSPLFNHKDKLCQQKYNPAALKEELPEGNTAAEQTFVWLSRFK